MSRLALNSRSTKRGIDSDIWEDTNDCQHQRKKYAQMSFFFFHMLSYHNIVYVV